MPKDDMGNPQNITEKTFEQASKASGQSVMEAKKHTFEQLKKEIGEQKVNEKKRAEMNPRAFSHGKQ